MGRPRIRALLVALICVLTLVSTSWGRSRVSYSLRRGHPNERSLRASVGASQTTLLIVRNPVSGTPMFVISIARILDSLSEEEQQTPTHIKQETPRD